MVSFTSLSPDKSVYQSLLSFPSVNVLIDLGWDKLLQQETLASLENIIQSSTTTIDLILLTHPTISHLGAYAYLCYKFPDFAQVPVYATLPVINMGRMITMEAYRSIGLLGPVKGSEISTNEIENYFDKISPLKYSQAISFSGLMITGFNAGHSLGGTIWKLQREQETVIYSVDFNHSKDTFLNGSSILQPNGTIYSSFLKPSTLIINTKTGTNTNTKNKTDLLIASIKDTLNSQGIVILPTSIGCRMLELCHILDNLWHDKVFGDDAVLLCLSHVGNRTLNYASSMFEWMSANIIKEWETMGKSPFSKHIKVVNSVDALKPYKDKPRVILVADELMEHGLSRILFEQMCRNENAKIILTEMPVKGSLAYRLYKLWQEKKGADRFTLKFTLEVPLKGSELTQYEQAIDEQVGQRNNTLKNELLNLENDSDSESDDDEDLISGTKHANMEDTYTTNFDIYLQNGTTKLKMFPYQKKRVRLDDYGEVIKHENYIRPEEQEIIVKTAMLENSENGNKKQKLGEKKLWQLPAGSTTNPNSITNNIEIDDTSKLNVLDKNNTPFKHIFELRDLNVICQINFFDFEGLIDQRSRSMIIPQLKPKKLIILDNGIEELSEKRLKDQFSVATDKIDDIFVAKWQEPIVTNTEATSFDVEISDKLHKLLKWQNISGGFSISHIVGTLKKKSIGNEDKYKITQENNTDANDPAEAEKKIRERNNEEFVLEPINANLSNIRTQPLVVGDIRLSELKRKLISMGYKAEYKGEGILVCDNTIIIRKLNEGNIIVDGGLDDKFYEVREIVRGLIAFV